jgi:hypothetical protein
LDEEWCLMGEGADAKSKNLINNDSPLCDDEQQ